MLSIPRRRPLVWALCAALSGAAWVLLLTGREQAGVTLLFAGGWNLTLLPVHARPRTDRPEDLSDEQAGIPQEYESF